MTVISSILEIVNKILDLFRSKEAKKAKEFEIKNTEAAIQKEEIRRETVSKDENERLVADLMKAPTAEKQKDILDEIRKKVSS